MVVGADLTPTYREVHELSSRLSSGVGCRIDDGRASGGRPNPVPTTVFGLGRRRRNKDEAEEC